MSFADKMNNQKKSSQKADKTTQFFMQDTPELVETEVKPRRVSVLLPEQLFQELTADAKAKGLTKNAYIVSLINQALGK